MTEAQQQHRFRTILAFGLVYFFWGSTYLGIGIAVEHIPAELMAGIRFTIAGSAMLAWCRLSGRKIAISRGDAIRLATIGILLLSVANTVLGWAEETLPTGLAALIVSCGVPLCFLVIDTWILRGDHLTPRGMMGLPLGIAGIVVLLWPKLRATTAVGHKELMASLALIGGSLSWAIGSVLARRWQGRADPFTASGWEMTFAGLTNLCIAFAIGDHHEAVWSARGLGAIAYLIVFGSWVGYSAYIWLLQNVPMPKVATYAYVNPVVAVFLGWIILHERVDGYIMVGSAVVVAAVALVTSAQVRSKPGEEQGSPLPACESTGD